MHVDDTILLDARRPETANDFARVAWSLPLPYIGASPPSKPQVVFVAEEIPRSRGNCAMSLVPCLAHVSSGTRTESMYFVKAESVCPGNL